jgi:hypothetical protein
LALGLIHAYVKFDFVFDLTIPKKMACVDKIREGSEKIRNDIAKFC